MSILKTNGIAKYFTLSLILFFLSGVAGYFIACMHPHQAGELVNSSYEPVKEAIQSSYEMIKKTIPKDSNLHTILFFAVVFLTIFINNTVKSFLAMLLGIFFGIFPMIFILMNGLVVGFVIYVSGSEIGTIKTIIMLLPHGIFEIPAVLLACSYGLWLGESAYLYLQKKDVRLLPKVKHALVRFCKIVIPTLFLAAIIEASLIVSFKQG